MATQTTNYNLSKPEVTDPFSQFRQSYNDNLDIIDANLGGGGGSGGHTIIDENDTPMTQRTGLQFTGNVSVSDDAVNDKTVVDIKGGAVFGFAIDENRKLFEGTMTNFTQTLEYTATEDAIALIDYSGSNGTNQWFLINGVTIPFQVLSSGRESFTVPIRKGDKISARHASDNENCFFHLACYGIKQGTNGIFAPVIYSDNERIIGVWRDNKPLYQKTLHGVGSYGAGVDVTVAIPADVENLQIVGGFVDIGTDWLPLELTFGLGSPNTNGIYCYPNKTTGIHIYSSAWTFTEYVVTIQYTKTTDVAGSGNWNTDGVPTVHYSTSEQVIGTYLGKPLYEITADFSTELTVPSNTFTNTEISTTDKKAIISVVGTNSTGTCWNFLSANCDNGSYVQIYHTRSSAITLKTLTIRYTKTTD